MNNVLPDRVVIGVIALTIVLVFVLIFSMRPNQNNTDPLLWKEDSPPPPQNSLAI